MTKINDIITDENGKLYAETAIWCNENNAMLEEIEAKDGIRRFKIIPVPEATAEEKQKQVRSVRNQYLEQTDKFMLTDYPITDDERELYKQYRTYLRIYTEANLWYESNPFTFDEWKKLTIVTDTEDLYEQKPMTLEEWKQASELELDKGKTNE